MSRNGRKDDAYSPLKATRHLDIIQGVREGKPVRPAHVQLILSDLCNQACGFCAYRDPSYSSSQMFYEIKPSGGGLRKDEAHPDRNYNPNRMIDTEKAAEILNDCAALGVSGIQFTGGGEPTVHPDFTKIVLNAQALGLATSLVTNGVVIGRKWNEEWATVIRNMAWVRFSIDAGSHTTYTNIRNVPIGHFTAALSAIRSVRDERDRTGKGPVIGTGFVVTPDNWHEVYECAQLMKENGADNIRISAQFSTEDEKKFEAFHKDCAFLCEKAVADFGDENFRVFNRFGEKLDDLKQKRPDYDTCGYQQITTYIGADLNVYRCCVVSYNKHGLVGNVKNKSFQELWLSQERADEMARFDAKSCDRCQFNTINRNLEYMMRKDNPTHSEFV